MAGSLAVRGVVLGLVVLAVMALMNHRAARSQLGETWRRGLLAGDQIRLLQDKSYELSQWCRICANEVIESGTWAQMGEVVSLVPYSGQPPRLMKKLVRDGERYLADPRGANASSEDAMFVRID